MIYVKDHKQRDMFNPFAHLGKKHIALLESSWVHLFREEILHNLPAEKLFWFYDVTGNLKAPFSWHLEMVSSSAFLFSS